MNMQEQTVVPETFSSDREPKPMPVRIKKVNNRFKDPLGKEGFTFQIKGFGYRVDKVLNRMRRLIKCLGVVDVDSAGTVTVQPIPTDAKYDPLGEEQMVFQVQGVAYRVNNAMNNKGRRTIKCMGEVIYEEGANA